MRLAHAARRDVRQCAKIIKKKCSPYRKTPYFCHRYEKNVFAIYESVCLSVSSGGEVCCKYPPPCNLLPVNSLRENMDSAADRRSGAFGGLRSLRGFKVSGILEVSKVSRFQGFKGFKGFKSFKGFRVSEVSRFQGL